MMFVSPWNPDCFHYGPPLALWGQDGFLGREKSFPKARCRWLFDGKANQGESSRYDRGAPGLSCCMNSGKLPNFPEPVSLPTKQG